MGQRADEIEHEVERQRAHIRGSAGELKDRLSPESLVSNGVEYMRGPGGDRLVRAARDNPLAALLVIAGAGWLLYTASRQHNNVSRMRSPDHRQEDGAGGSVSGRVSDWDDDLSTHGPVSATRETPPRPQQPQSPSASGAARPGVLGDQTQAQKLSQPGKHAAQVTEADVKSAFGHSSTNR